MIYFDNAATGGFKPRTVFDAAENVMHYLSANPGRSGHRLSVTGGKIVYDCRKELAELFRQSHQLEHEIKKRLAAIGFEVKE